jgi:hypothetical protein
MPEPQVAVILLPLHQAWNHDSVYDYETKHGVLQVSTEFSWTSTPSLCFSFIHPSTSPTTSSTECPSYPVGEPSDQTISFYPVFPACGDSPHAVIDHVSPETVATLVSLLNTYPCHALHLFDEMPDRPSSCLFLVVVMPHAPLPQLAVALGCRPSSRAFLAGAARRRLLAYHFGCNRPRGHGHPLPFCRTLIPCNVCRLAVLCLSIPALGRTYPLCLPVDKSLSVARALGR